MMKYALLISTIVVVTSCGMSDEEQMFYDYMNELTIQSVNMSAKDLDFKLISFKKDGVVTAKDSIDYFITHLPILRNTLSEDKVFIAKTLEEIKSKKLELESDELKLNRTTNLQRKSILQDLVNVRQEQIDLIQKQIDLRIEYSDERQLNFKKASSSLVELKLDPSRVISTRYEVYYSMHMPDTDLTMTTKVLAYTNRDNSKFLVREEQRI